jgi:hypothetical protein
MVVIMYQIYIYICTYIRTYILHTYIHATYLPTHVHTYITWVRKRVTKIVGWGTNQIHTCMLYVHALHGSVSVIKTVWWGTSYIHKYMHFLWSKGSGYLTFFS